MCNDYLSLDEGEYCQTLLSQLHSVRWIQPLIAKINSNGGVTNSNKDLLFEFRFAAELIRLGNEGKYEHKAFPPSSVDFYISNGYSWLIELFRIGISKAVKSATTEMNGVWKTMLISSPELFNKEGELTDAMKQSEEGECLIVQQKICEKVFVNDKATKFPVVNDNVFHMLLVDMRHFLLGKSDAYDYDFIAFGKNGVPDDIYVRYWNGEPIKGIFEVGNPLRASKTLQERIHFIGFVNESTFGHGKFIEQTYFLANPNLFESQESADIAFSSFPVNT